MILINNIIVQDEVTQERFSCDLNACKGACCWEGDYGAPLEKEEVDILEEMEDVIKDYLDKKSIDLLEAEGGTKYFYGPKFVGTNLHSNGACVYLMYKDGISLCAIEQAWLDKKISFHKPISCHLYPIRIEHDKHTLFETMQYDQWEICADACVKGKKENIKVYEFAKTAIVRKYGLDFYEQLDAAAKADLE